MTTITGLLIVLSVALTNAATIGRVGDVKVVDDCTSKVYCEGNLLKTVQLAEVFNDSKTFVDLYQLNNPDVTLSNFDALMKRTNNKPDRTEVIKFVKENFNTTDELLEVTPQDWKESPSILKRVSDPNYREWLKNLNQIWKKLARKMSDEVRLNPDRHSLIYVNNTFVIPGGRFKEFYYWDSYWILEGLLLSDMHQTAKGMIENFLSMVEQFGFVPNGGRIYYLVRSQPPLLIPMVNVYLKFTNDYEFLNRNIATLEKEFDFWQKKRTVNVEKDGKTYKMARYFCDSPNPRPESFREDYNYGQKLPVSLQGMFYNNLKAAAESGWDFSSRWFLPKNGESGSMNLLNVSTTDIIPVELNSILQGNAQLLSKFHHILNNNEKSRYYSKMAAQYQYGIDNVLLSKTQKIWFDYDIRNNRSRNGFHPSNLAPLWTTSYDSNQKETYALHAVKYLKNLKIDSFYGGTPTSLNETGEQWDFPNAWPPLQSIIIQGLYQTEVKEAIDFAIELASRWLRSNYAGYSEYGAMFEKYSAAVPGTRGGGGEYTVQEGFGWTNGVVFELLNLFPASRFKENGLTDA